MNRPAYKGKYLKMLLFSVTQNKRIEELEQQLSAANEQLAILRKEINRRERHCTYCGRRKPVRVG